MVKAVGSGNENSRQDDYLTLCMKRRGLPSHSTLPSACIWYDCFKTFSRLWAICYIAIELAPATSTNVARPTLCVGRLYK